MSKYLDETQFAELKQQLSSGEKRLVLDRRVARQLFTHVTNQSIIDTTGRSMRIQKVVITAGLILPLLLLLASFVAAGYLLGLFAMFLIPLLGILWTVVAGLTGDKGNWVHGLIGLAAGLIIAASIDPEYGIPLTIFSLSLWLHRVNYEVAGHWATALASESFGAYDMLVEHVKILENKTPDQSS